MNKTCTFGICAETFGMLTPSGTARKEHLVTISGAPPITLSHTLPHLISNITICGNTVGNAGVGDKTANLYRNHNTYIPVEANVEYVILRTDASTYIKIELCDEEYTQINQIYGYKDYMCFITKPLQSGYLRIGGQSQNAWVSHPGIVNCVINDGIARKKNPNASPNNSIISANLIKSYTYKPYGYKIPLLIDAKTVNIYSDTQLGSGNTLTLSPETQTAARDMTDISSLQDWAQDFTLPKTDSVFISTNTSVDPESISVRYYSRARI